MWCLLNELRIDYVDDLVAQMCQLFEFALVICCETHVASAPLSHAQVSTNKDACRQIRTEQESKRVDK